MATNLRGEGSYSDRSKLLIRDPCFFKVVMFPSNQGLTIPDAFIRTHGRDLQDMVLLKVPTGVSWQVELVHYGNGTRLQKGWEEFAKYYSIKKFHFLVFRYGGNSQFLVLVFDQTALEIDYPLVANCDGTDISIRKSGQRGNSCMRTELKVSSDDEECKEISAQILEKYYQTTPASKGKRALEDIEDDVSIEMLDDLSECKPNIRFSHKLMKENPRMNPVKPDTEDGNSACLKEMMNMGGKSSVETREPLKCSTSISSYKTVTNKENFKSYEKAKAFTSSNPFFISFMQSSYVSGKFNLEIPANFTMAYLSKKKEQYSLVLHVSGKIISWPVTASLRSSRRSRVRGRITVGWRKFVEDNGLRVGDCCVFELVPGTRNFNLTLFIN